VYTGGRGSREVVLCSKLRRVYVEAAAAAAAMTDEAAAAQKLVFNGAAPAD